MLLNLGCGNVYAQGWTNVDHAGCPHPRDETVDLAGPLPWSPGTVELAYAGHVLEHLTLSQCLVLLHELRRVMVPGGQLLVVGPDLELAERFGPGMHHTLDELRHGGQRWPGDAHRWECTTAAVMDLLTAAGWANVTDVGIAQVPGFWPVADRRPPWQLAVSATAPLQRSTTVAETTDEPPPGTWRVIDADGNVVQSGGAIHLEMATALGEQEEETDGSD